MSRIAPGIKSRVDRDLFPDLETILEAAEAVGALRQQPGWAIVQKVITTERAELERRLNMATEPLSQAQYAQAHGRLGGLGYVGEVLDAIVERAATRFAEEQAKVEGAPERAPEGART